MVGNRERILPDKGLKSGGPSHERVEGRLRQGDDMNRLVPIAFLTVGLLLVFGPLIARALVSHGLDDDVSLHNTYYVIASRFVALSYPAASALFAIIYWVGARAGLSFHAALLWSHLALWATGSLLVFAPFLLTPVISVPYFEEPEAYFARLHLAPTAGYCVALLSAVIFGICIGYAILGRIRRGIAL